MSVLMVDRPLEIFLARNVLHNRCIAGNLVVLVEIPYHSVEGAGITDRLTSFSFLWKQCFVLQ